MVGGRGDDSIEFQGFGKNRGTGGASFVRLADACLAGGLLILGKKAALAVEAGWPLEDREGSRAEPEHLGRSIETGPNGAAETVAGGGFFFTQLEFDIATVCHGGLQFHLGRFEAALFQFFVFKDFFRCETGAKIAHQFNQLPRLGLADGPVAGHGPAIFGGGKGDRLLGWRALDPDSKTADGGGAEFGQRVHHNDLTLAVTQVG